MKQEHASEAPKFFAENKYLFVKGLLRDPLLMTAHRYALMQAQVGEKIMDDPQAPDTPSFYADVLMESLLELLCPTVEQMTGLSLHPTYSYFRVYKRGDVLAPHRDRSSCEISMTVTLGFEALERWPFYCSYEGHATQVELDPGDAIVYRGCEVQHWRDEFKGEHQAQAFLHYVDRNGPYAEWKNDKRPMLGLRAPLSPSRPES